MTEKIDRRVRKTKAALRSGLMKLMKNKSIHEITVRELVEEVDINRSTFYLHYTDIYDMLTKIEQELLDELINATTKHKTEYCNNRLQHYLQEVFTIIFNNMDICQSLMSSNGDINFTNNVKHLIKDNITQSTIELLHDTKSVEEIEYACSFYIGGCVGIIEKWLSGQAKQTPEELSILCYNLIRNGVASYIPSF